MENRINKKLVLLFIAFSVFTFAQETYLWKVTSKNRKHTSYLFGTMHMAGESFYHQYPVLNESLLACNIVVTESEVKKEIVAERFNDRPVSNDLESVLSAEEYARLNKAFEKSEIDIKKLKRDEIVKSLQVRAWYSGCNESTDRYILDAYIQKQGKDNEKQMFYLETSKMQQDYLDASKTSRKSNWKSGTAVIRGTLKRYEKAMESNKKKCSGMQKDYLELKDRYVFNKPCESLGKGEQILLTERNGKWMKILPEMIEENNVFLAVGLGHFSYSCGLIEEFKKLGYLVEPVPMK